MFVLVSLTNVIALYHPMGKKCSAVLGELITISQYVDLIKYIIFIEKTFYTTSTRTGTLCHGQLTYKKTALKACIFFFV